VVCSSAADSLEVLALQNWGKKVDHAPVWSRVLISLALAVEPVGG